MENSVLLYWDDSCGFFSFFRRDDEYRYRYPVVYEDGLVSYLKSASQGRKAWGFVYKGYAVSIVPAPYEMFPEEAKEFCQKNSFAGRNYCLLPWSVMTKMMRKVLVVNDLIRKLGGVPVETKWYMAENDHWLNEKYCFIPELCGVKPKMNYVREIVFVGKDAKADFYPAIKL